MSKKSKLLFLPRNKAHPNQAGFVRRFSAFALDTIIITILSIFIYLGYSEAVGALGGEPGVITQSVDALKEGTSISMVIDYSDKRKEKFIKRAYLNILKKRLSPEDYEHAKEMSSEEMKDAFPEELVAGKIEHRIISSGEAFGFIQEIIIAYVYFVLFFHFGGRTPGKRLLRLKVVDLKGRDRLRWYQSFERAHGYAASALVASIGFLQVLWDAEGLTMHDKIARTTVIKLPKKKKIKKRKIKRKKK